MMNESFEEVVLDYTGMKCVIEAGEKFGKTYYRWKIVDCEDGFRDYYHSYIPSNSYGSDKMGLTKEIIDLWGLWQIEKKQQKQSIPWAH